jgi:AcrR family transcriptional regulator
VLKQEPVPKQVDHAARRAELAAALWRLVMRDGIEAASLRAVAAEAGWSVGSVRHYFSSHGELLAFAMELVAERVAQRVRGAEPEPDPRAEAARLLHQVLPMDAERLAEMRVWLAFTSRALVDPELAELRDAAHTALRGLCVEAAALLGAADPECEGERLHALVDGLALHAVLDPATTNPARQARILVDEFDRIG